jgi:hypothetical protein
LSESQEGRSLPNLQIIIFYESLQIRNSSEPTELGGGEDLTDESSTDGESDDEYY